MRALAPALARHAQDPSFPSLGVRERQLTLDCLQRLAPATAEAVACALVRKHGLLRDDAFSSTRVLAASLLEQVGATQQSVGALRAAEVPIWWNPPEVREAALRARNAVLQRIRALAGQQA
jgi:hypothetical protein